MALEEKQKQAGEARGLWSKKKRSKLIL
jgi:hypothetical protein